MILAIALALSFWHYNEQANQLEYWITYKGEVAPHTCGFVSRSNIDEGMYVADALGSGGASETVSMEFNTIDGAKAFVEAKCR